MRYIDKGFIEYEANVAKERLAQKEEAIEMAYYLTQIRDDPAILGAIDGVRHYNKAIKELERK